MQLKQYFEAIMRRLEYSQTNKSAPNLFRKQLEYEQSREITTDPDEILLTQAQYKNAMLKYFRMLINGQWKENSVIVVEPF